MLDRHARKLIDPPLNVAGRGLAAMGIGANTVTSAGLVLGLGAALAIVYGHMLIGLALIIASRLADGLDGAIARASKTTDLGGFLDITFDFFFYAAVPLAFLIHDPQANALAGAVLLASFYASGTTFLAFAVMAEKRGMATSSQGIKSLYYLGGLAEGTETIAAFVLMCLWPASFAMIAWVFAGLCFLSAATRVINVAYILTRR
ncbi:CDP-alcohol phosphatidyltransferase family protein [Breoghania sp. L-A4]|uniref:CDP-alcohol phosphatidyltransferase family protein n=1 Tax=Breoghania sp. L-A4 TaxID=2304600 RepID=UPI000E35C634|nr:CDP-alcohol phosphatidyltransferase family protein [Breoghania sp. L-A4]AXS39632.1 CDP-alcohol phosphatidyltransferase family protein [Breoghania sp. L-A4]